MADDDAEHTLNELRRLRAASRRTARAGRWFPAALLAALVLASTALYRSPFTTPWTGPEAELLGTGAGFLDPRYPAWAGLPDAERSATVSYVFWLVGLPLVVLASGWWYRRRQERVGVRVSWQRYAVITMAALAALLVAAATPGFSPYPPAGDGPHLGGLFSPLLAVAVATGALAWAERSRGLLVAAVWLAVVGGWQCAMGLGGLPGWATWLLGGFEGPALGGQLTLFGLDRAGPTLVIMALPLLAVVALAAGRGRRT